LVRKTLQDDIYDNIRKPILDLEFRPGERIKIEDLAQKLGVSRTPVREVLQRLKTEGLVRFIPRVGPVVEDISEKEIRDLFAIRMSLETLVVKQTIKRITDKDTGQLNQILRKTKDEVQRGDAKKVRILNRKFHATIYQNCDNEHLKRYLEDIFSKLQRYLNILSGEDTIRISATAQHEKILYCIKERDLDGVQKAIEEHLVFSEKALIRIVNNKYSDWLTRDE